MSLQGVALVILEIAVPGRFREHIDAPALHPAFATAVMLLAVAGVVAAAARHVHPAGGRSHQLRYGKGRAAGRVAAACGPPMVC